MSTIKLRLLMRLCQQQRILQLKHCILWNFRLYFQLWILLLYHGSKAPLFIIKNMLSKILLMPKRMFGKIFNFSHHKTLSSELRRGKKKREYRKDANLQENLSSIPTLFICPEECRLENKNILPRQLKTAWNWWDSLTNLHNNVMINCMLL